MRFPADMPVIKGRAAIQEQIQAGMDEGLAKVKIKAHGIDVNGNIGNGWGTFEAMDAEGNSLGKGKWVNYAKYVDGKWQVQYDIFNYDAPQPAME